MTESYVLHIDSLDPKALPMARLAEYMARFAKILGHEDGVYIDGIRPGSTNIACRIDPAYTGVVEEGLQELAKGRGAKAAQSAYEGMLKMLAKDNAKAAIFASDEKGALDTKIIDFAPAPRSRKEMEIEQDDQISGYLIDIDAEIDPAKLRLRSEKRIYTGIRAEQGIAEKIAVHLYRPVRLFGSATWTCSAQGVWDLKGLQVVDFKRLGEMDLLEVFDRIREIEGMEWREFDDPLAAFHALRHGPD